MARLGPEVGSTALVALHTSRFPDLAQQSVELVNLAGVLEHTAGPKIVAGDFNATPTSRILSDFEQRLGLERSTSLPSWPGNWGLPLLAIDHFFIGGGVSSLGPERLGPASGSDHFPITQTFAVPGQ